MRKESSVQKCKEKLENTEVRKREKNREGNIVKK